MTPCNLRAEELLDWGFSCSGSSEVNDSESESEDVDDEEVPEESLAARLLFDLLDLVEDDRFPHFWEDLALLGEWPESTRLAAFWSELGR